MKKPLLSSARVVSSGNGNGSDSCSSKFDGKCASNVWKRSQTQENWNSGCTTRITDWQLTANTTTIQSVEAIIEDKLNYPYSAFAAVLLDSNDFTSIPKRSYEVRGIKCKVPTNYFPRDEINTDGNRLSVAKYTRNIRRIWIYKIRNQKFYQ